jgi:hypothetical protein
LFILNNLSLSSTKESTVPMTLPNPRYRMGKQS